MSTTTVYGVDVRTLDGVDETRPGVFRLRMRFPDRRWTRAGLDAKGVYALHTRWVELREAGLTPAHDDRARATLGAAADDLYAAKVAEGRLSPRGLEWWARVLRPWRDGPLAATPLDLLDPNVVEDAIRARAAKHPKTAADERAGFLATCRRARKRGARFDDRLLTLDPVRRTVRVREALDASELRFLADHAPAYAVRLVEFAGTTGFRWGQVVNLRDSWVDEDARTVTIPEAFRKERGARRRPVGDLVVPLFDRELELIREQRSPLRVVGDSPTAHLPARPAGTDLVFPAAEGGAYAHHKFLRLVWYKARTRAGHVARAAGDDRLAAKLARITPHDLRSTAVTLMRTAGMSRDVVATRIGHHDDVLIRTIYDQSDGLDALVAAMGEVRGSGLLAHADEVAGRATTPARATSPGPLKGTS